jgi:hypothetical protein
VRTRAEPVRVRPAWTPDAVTAVRHATAPTIVR